YANNDPNLDGASPEEMRQLQEINQTVFFYLPRICNHCLNPGCVAACPQGAIYKRGEDGVVLVSQERCRAWRMCVSVCPYKKTYFNWATGKAEKCILCYPRLESGQPPACFHSCVGRIRYIGLLLYDADAIEEAAKAPQESLVQAQRDVIKDPFDPEVIAAAKASGIPDSKIDAAQKWPVYQFVKKWGLALPLHPEFRTLPMLFYVPPLGPVLAKTDNGVYDNVAAEGRLGPLMSSLERSRVPLRYMASLLAGGNEQIIRERLSQAGFVVPPMERDTAVESMFPVLDPVPRNYPTYKGAVGTRLPTSLPTFEERTSIRKEDHEPLFEACRGLVFEQELVEPFSCAIMSRKIASTSAALVLPSASALSTSSAGISLTCFARMCTRTATKVSDTLVTTEL